MSENRKGYVGIYEYARIMQRSVKHVYDQIRVGKIPAKKLGRKWQIPKSELNGRI